MSIPHSLAIIVVVMLLASILTYVIPAGSYDRVVNEAGQTVVDPNSFHYVEASPVNPLTIFSYIYPGLDNARSIIFLLLSAGGGLGIVLDTGVFQAAAGFLSRRTKGKESLVIAALMTIFCLLCVPINLNTFIPFASLGVLIAASLGFDAIVGVSIILLGGAVGFSCGAMNLSNTGTAQQLAELDIFSGMAYRLFCMIPFLIATILYVLWYAKKIKKDPTKSYVYGAKLENNFDTSNIPEFTKAHILPSIVTALGIGYIIYVAIFKSLTNQTSTTIFIYLGFIVGIVARMPINKICQSFVNGAKGMCSTAMLLGFAYAISAILTAGNVMDTVVYALASALSLVPEILQAPAMFMMHVIVNFFVTSGSGQAAITMPIFIPVADLVHMSRQTAVLAFNFGDGFCNFILPHAAATMGFVGAAGIPFSR